MLPERFAEAVDKVRSANLARRGSRKIVLGHMRDGRQVAVFRGYRPGETPLGSIGHFLIVSSQNSEAEPLPDSKDGADEGMPDTEVIAAGSTDVRHPSYDSYHGGREPLQVTARLGRLSLPTAHGALPMLDGEPIYPHNVPIPPEPAVRPADTWV